MGEAGPEIFTPSSSGSVASNKSIPTAEEIGASVAAALHRVPLVVPQDAVTDAMLRRTPNGVRRSGAEPREYHRYPANLSALVTAASLKHAELTAVTSISPSGVSPNQRDVRIVAWPTTSS